MSAWHRSLATLIEVAWPGFACWAIIVFVGVLPDWQYGLYDYVFVVNAPETLASGSWTFVLVSGGWTFLDVLRDNVEGDPAGEDRVGGRQLVASSGPRASGAVSRAAREVGDGSQTRWAVCSPPTTGVSRA